MDWIRDPEKNFCRIRYPDFVPLRRTIGHRLPPLALHSGTRHPKLFLISPPSTARVLVLWVVWVWVIDINYWYVLTSYPNLKAVSVFFYFQCGGSGSGIRCLFYSWSRDLGSGIIFSRISDPKHVFVRAWWQFFWVYLNVICWKIFFTSS